MSETNEWYYLAGEEQVGPLTAEALQELIAEGTILPETQLWAEGLEGWIPASSVEGLFAPAPSQRPKLVLGSAAQAAHPLAGEIVSPAATAAAVAQAGHPVEATPVAAASVAPEGYNPGGTPLSAGLSPAPLTKFQIRSVGILQAGVICALLMAITIFLILLMVMALIGTIGGLIGDTEVLQGLAGGGIKLVIAPIISGIFGFFYGIIAALIYNLAAKIGGGLVVRVQASAA
jgi:hypothetical protein